MRIALLSMIASLVVTGGPSAAPTDLAQQPFLTETEGVVTVRPNMYFILDDSGSMSWDYLPDWTPSSYCKNNTGTSGGSCANTRPPMRSPDYNAVFYNPAIPYLPPLNADGSEKTSYDGLTAVPYDAFSGGSTLNLTTNYADEEWCVGSSTTDCLRADNYLVPGTLFGKDYTTRRSVLASGTKTFVSGTAAAPITADRGVGPYYYVMIPGEYCSDPKLVNCQVMPGPGFQGGTYYGYPAKVRWCTGDGVCQGLRVGSYSNIRYPTLNIGGGTIVPGSFRRTDIVSGNSYGNLCVSATGTVSEVMGACPSGQTTIVDRSSRIDCASKPTCTYAEELRNFANWHAWYRTRMQMAKSSLSRAFSTIGDTFRVGFFTINGQRLVNPAPFDAAQKSTWYTTMLDTPAPYGTPLRLGLSYAGRLFAGKKTSVFDGATDPIEYSCQRNFAILSTDGYWNGAAGKKIDGSAIGNEDSSGMVIGGVSGPFSDSWSNTLADVAAYYYKTDLRDSSLGNCTGALGTGVNVCADNVPTSTLQILRDFNTKQHMVTFTIGLGIDGVMNYRHDYQTPSSEPTDDYSAVQNATTANPAQGICSWKNSGEACSWPQPAENQQTAIDDLWHAAVNGHGKYFSARDAFSLTNGLQQILTAIGAKVGAGAAAATSSPNAVVGDNFVFSSTYKTSDWTSTFFRETIDPATGSVGFDSSKDWYANTLLDSGGWSTRNIYTFKVGGGATRDFTWTSLASSGTTCNPPLNEVACFADTHISPNLSQWAGLTAANKTAAAGVNLVNFLRGDKANEDTSTEAKLYRERKSRLGDIVNSEGFYVGSYLYQYGDGYPAKGTARANPTVYVAANDGMLHAFNGGDAGIGGGSERWAYIPSMVIKDMHRLASKDYPHRYFVDGSPTAVDVYSGGAWKTILVGGLNAGGPGFYALDITDQTSPKVLWEFRQKSGCTATTPAGGARYGSSGISRIIEDCDLGYSYGNPIITKLPGGSWVVLLTSGYNNHETGGFGGDGKGYLYVLDAFTGAVQSKVTTGEGSASDPSGFTKIAAWTDNYNTDNTSKYVYGGDLKGNMWKFDLTSGTPTKSLLYSPGSTKPITAKPKLGLITTKSGLKKRVVFFPTGKLLGLSDLEPTGTYSFYAIWDDPSGAATVMVSASAAGGSGTRTGAIYDPNSDGVSDSVFDDSANKGWKLDFPASGERGTTDPALIGSTLVFTTNQPQPGSSDPCNKSAFQGWLWMIDYKSGHAVNLAGETGNRPMAEPLGGYGTRPSIVVLQSGKPVSITTVTKGSGVERRVDQVRIEDNPEGAKRVTWRELTQ
jgi:type IV pilus assembly protein PilY1